MNFPNGFLEKRYGLTPDLPISKDLIFEYYIFADELNVTRKGRGFTVQSKQTGANLAKYINQQVLKI